MGWFDSDAPVAAPTAETLAANPIVKQKKAAGEAYDLGEQQRTGQIGALNAETSTYQGAAAKLLQQQNTGLAGMDAAKSAGLNSIDQKYGQALSGAQSAGGMRSYGGAASYGGGLQAAQSSGMDSAKFGADAANQRAQYESMMGGQIQGAQQAAASKLVQNGEAITKLGTASGDASAKINSLQAEIGGKQWTHFYGNDRDAARQYLNDKLAQEGDPAVQAWLKQQLDNVDNNWANVQAG